MALGTGAGGSGMDPLDEIAGPASFADGAGMKFVSPAGAGESSFHWPPGNGDGGWPASATFMNLLQTSTGSVLPDAFLVGEPSSLPSHTPVRSVPV